MISRRTFCLGGVAAALTPASLAHSMTLMPDHPNGLSDRAFAAFDRHRGLIAQRDRIGIVDFSLPSRKPRFQLLDLASGASQTLLVAHGKGSDPDHSGWLKQFSNEPGSEASSAGTYLSGALYEGKHGRSRRLIGLDDSNSNAENRALVIHGAWYVGQDMIRDHGKLGRSQGCLAVAGDDLERVLALLPEGSMIYVDKL